MIKDIQCPNCDNVSKYGEYCQCCNAALPDDYLPDPNLYTPCMGAGGVNNFDPRIERQFARSRHEIYRPASGSTQEGEIPVIMKATEGELLPKYCREIIRIHSPEGMSEPFDLVTARVPLRKISELDKNIIIKYPSNLRPCLEDVSKAIRLDEQNKIDGNIEPRTFIGGQPDTVSDNVKCNKVIVGIVDFGIDFAHKHFLKKNKTRIIALWDQSGTSMNRNSRDIKYGTLYRKKEINNALLYDQPYQALGYEPPLDSLYDTGAHGTYVTDIAAGNGYNGGGKGIAPDADIIFVDLARSSNHNIVGSRFGDSAHLLEAVHFIFEEVKRIENCEGSHRPVVINLSVGSNDGPHDGYTPVEIGIDWLIEAKKNCAVVVAAGNSADKFLHAEGKVENGSFLDVLWYIPPYDMTSNEIELWHSMKDKFAVQILDPDNAPLCKPVECGEYAEISLGSEGGMIIFNRESDPYNDQRKEDEKKAAIYIFYERRDKYLKKGRWKLRLFGENIEDGSFDAWIERDERGQSVFVKPCHGSNVSFYDVSEDNTLNSIANGRNTIVVGSWDFISGNPSGFSSQNVISHTVGTKGPEPTREIKPHILAPGENILAARSRTSVLRYRQSGTSIAAAVVTGVIAEMFCRKPGLEYTVIRDIIKGPRSSGLTKGDGQPPRLIDAGAAIKSAEEWTVSD